MATKEIKDFAAVVTPAGADLMVTQQDADDVTRKMTAAQIVGTTDPKAHAALHISGAADPFTSAQLLEAIVKRIQTTTGPTTLLVGAVSDGATTNEVLARSGTAIISVLPVDNIARALSILGG